MFGELPPARHGQSYLGLVIRADGSTEAIGQALPLPLREGQCYQFQAFLAHADTYLSADPRALGRTYNNAVGAGLRIWGGNSPCQTGELLGSLPPVNHPDWQSHTLILHPSQDWSYLLLEAYHPTDSLANGHLLMDQLAPLLPVDCESGRPLAPVAQVKVPVLTDASRLPAFFETCGPDWQFIGDQLPITLFQVQDGSFRYGNQVLYQLAAAATQIPGYQLTLGVRSADRRQFNLRTESIKRNLRQLGFPDLPLQLIRLQPGANGKQWAFHQDQAPVWIR
jgi:hypothetical protein